MNEQIKDILINSKISIQWKTINPKISPRWSSFKSWRQEYFNNLYEAVVHYHITFKTNETLNQQGDKEIIITLNKNITIEKRSNIVCLERDTCTVIKMYLFYLGLTFSFYRGDKTHFVTRFNAYNTAKNNIDKQKFVTRFDTYNIN
jgi:hypothetical protein